MNSDHNGQARFITPRILATENVWAAARPRGGERPDFRGTQAPTDEQIKKVADYESHATARAGAARAASRRMISNEEVNGRAAVDARSAATDTAATLAEVATLRAALEAQAATIEHLQGRLDALDSNSFVGEVS